MISLRVTPLSFLCLSSGCYGPAHEAFINSLCIVVLMEVRGLPFFRVLSRRFVFCVLFFLYSF